MLKLNQIPATRRFAFLKEEAGSGLVEYAIVFTVFMTVLLGIADFGRAMYAYHFVSSAARDATRYAIVRGCSTISTNCPAQASATDIQNFVKNVPQGIDATKVTFPTISWTLPGGGNDPNHKPGSTLRVEVDYAFHFAFPFVSASTLTMKSTSQMVVVQ